MFFVSSIAVVAIDGGPRDPGVGVAGGVSEAFFNVAILFLVSVPLATAAIGWVAATATARIRYGDLDQRSHDSIGTPNAAEAAAERSHSQTLGLLLLRALVAMAVVMAVTLFVLTR